MSLKTYITQEIHDKSGKRILYKKRRSHSFTLQFLDILAAHMAHASQVVGPIEPVLDIANTARNIQALVASDSTEILALEAPGANVNYGIVIGRGTNAEAGTDYVLQTPIAEGAGANQMNYGATAVTTAVQAGGITSFTIVRAMGNNSGNSIDVEEVGIYMASYDNGGLVRYFCILRDLTGTTAVGNGQTYTVTYTIQTSI